MTVPELTLVQFSDTHILPEGELMHGQVDTLANLEAAIELVAASRARVSALLLTGDLTDSGAPEAYRRLRGVIAPFAERLGAEVVYVPGNHDERTAFRAELLDGGQAADRVHWVGDVRIVVLDSSVPGRHDGHLSDAQLDWLAGELARPAPRGTVLVLHHPPLPSPVPTVHLLRLRGAERLGAVVAGSDVRLIVTGHAHHTSSGVLGAIPVWVSPALAYRVDAMSPSGRLRGAEGAGFTRIDLIDGTLVATALPVEPGPAVYDSERDAMVRFIQDLTPEME
ncbi:icc protein [Streptomyces himastatinicus ATCC 53653]|uniref:Icc protein n=1 Tax=Streptomyces himastatinicus ATCC 53653 TaxID=457427 RepID=D9WQF4_9ACTN|nr:metallophosphoesterase [Streptomyces himastatinicus]EFL28087.1 icc protein [Streptomyces himastatinicus ATCC 53653]